MDEESINAVQWLLRLRPEDLPTAASAERLRSAVDAVVAAIRRGEYRGLTGDKALVEYLESLPDSVRWPLNRESPHLAYGQNALWTKFFALPPWPRSRPEGVWEEPPDERVLLECELVDDWAVALFDYCRQQAFSGLRMMAMIDNAERIYGALYQSGVVISRDAVVRIKFWQCFASRLP